MGVRMHDADDAGLALIAVAEGWSRKAAGELVGAAASTVSRWATGRAPHARAGGRGMGGRRAEEAPSGDSERAAFEAAMTENMLLKAVLDDLKAGGPHPLSISSRRRRGPGGRSRATTGLPLREITRFLGISRSSHSHRRARLGRDRYAALRGEAGRGSRCRLPGWIAACRACGLARSMSRKGRSRGDARMEASSGPSRAGSGTRRTGPG